MQTNSPDRLNMRVLLLLALLGAVLAVVGWLRFAGV